MHEELAWIETIAPDFLEVIRRRYYILQHIGWMQPVGRRVLAIKLDMGERALRTETDFLRAQGLIDTSKSGMILTDSGQETLSGLENFMGQILDVHQQEQQLIELLGIDHVLIVAGDSDDQPRVLKDIGRLVNETLRLLLPDGENIIAVMGGTTMAQVAKKLTPKLSVGRQLTFVPARGGIGEAVDIQANTVSATMAKHTGGSHRMLYVPEHVSKETYKTLLQEPSVQEVLQLIGKCNTVLHSIGEATLMAQRRGMSAEVIDMIKSEQAVAEAFGYFFNEAGEVVYKIPRIGLQIRDLDHIPYVFAIAGGHSKATAIQAYMKNAPSQTWLITDEGAAKQILKGVTL
ncbi:glycolyticproteinregulator [Agrilactobacillus composti DSM 18527 = JCM 14202]|uniref:Glycolyticproteinregulator n=1 Tax=Agrilactobacillus composti DSM 18527 = JCM 14202 TaxID=1423734 RepID=X0PF03_9LACO|nr:sugar-binding domain-containing protein [Agrilactobacillus composti]KRM35188.1 glycolyticproteinregulator [Agrilactobacillus composti DSM 18527 = JCM 14202]GAF40178.1 central glycolytic genes regulator [Agrilactobacillus composti DSM 18527 = JCM 14202]